MFPYIPNRYTLMLKEMGASFERASRGSNGWLVVELLGLNCVKVIFNFRALLANKSGAPSKNRSEPTL